MSKVLITGGTGSLGVSLVRRVSDAGHRVAVASRRPRRDETPANIEWKRVDLASGEGVAAALEGVEVVVHAASNPFRAAAVDVGGTRRLVDAARSAGVGHIVYISIVGIDEIPLGYYKHKRAAEGVIELSAVPFTILRATQFHSLIDFFLSKAASIPLVMPVAADFKFQPVAPSEVADQLTACIGAGPRRRVADFGGPEVLSLGEMAETWKDVRGVRKALLRLPVPGAVAAGFRAGKNTVLEGPRGSIRWRDWLMHARAFFSSV